MAELPLAGKSERLVSLDVFRGITIALMVLVNNPGTWGRIYDPLEHAPWDGWTPTDFVFPFFLFIVGVAMTLSFDKRIEKGQSRLRLFEQVVRRSIILFLLGLILTGFPNFRLIGPYILTIASLGFIYADEPIFAKPANTRAWINKILGWGTLFVALAWFYLDFEHFQGKTRGSNFTHLFPLVNDLGTSSIRLPGVLQRISVCYFFASIILLFTGVRGRIAWTIAILGGYWAIMRFVDAPGGFVVGSLGGTRDAPIGAPYPGSLNDWIDIKLLHTHLYSRRPDPEGILSTLPAIATVLCGILTGNWLKTAHDKLEKINGMIVAGIALLIAGLFWDFLFPINKKIWTSSYVLLMAGWSLLFLAFCVYFNDVKKWRKWSYAFQILGTNAILVFFGSGLMARLMGMIRVGSEGNRTSIKGLIYNGGFEKVFGPGETASLAFAIAFILLWVVLTYPLYRKQIFLKI